MQKISSLGRKIIIEIGKFIRRVDFNVFISIIIGILGIVLPYISSDNLISYFQFNSANELICYILKLVGIIFCVFLFCRLFGNLLVYWGRNIKSNIEIIEYIQRGLPQTYVSLEIINHENTDLIDCYGTLREAEYYVSPGMKISICDDINPNRKLLSWGAGSETEKVIVPRSNGSKVLNIASLAGSGGFVFWFHGWKSDQQTAGKYHVVVEMNGMIDNIPIKTIKFDCCFKSENYITPITPITTVYQKETENGSEIDERTVHYGGEFETVVEFVKCSDGEKKEKVRA